MSEKKYNILDMLDKDSANIYKIHEQKLLQINTI